MRHLSDEKTRDITGIAGAVLFGAASLMELVRMFIQRTPWPGFTSRIDWGLSVMSIVLWLGSAYVLARRQSEHRLVPICGAFALFAYGLLGTTARAPFGIVYVAMGVLMPILERLAFGGKLPLGQATDEPSRPAGPREIL